MESNSNRKLQHETMNHIVKTAILRTPRHH